MTWGSFKLRTFSHLIFMAQDISFFLSVQVPYFLCQLSFSTWCMGQILSSGEQNGIRFQSASDICVQPRTMVCSVWSNHSHWFIPYIFKSAITTLHHLNKKYLHHPKSWGMQFMQESRRTPLGQEKWLVLWLPATLKCHNSLW